MFRNEKLNVSCERCENENKYTAKAPQTFQKKAKKEEREQAKPKPKQKQTKQSMISEQRAKDKHK